jgi:hypothetical protein
MQMHLTKKSYAFFRRAKPIKPIKPEPKSHAAAGTGTTVTLVVAAAVTSFAPL